ncbi:MAG: hypothetical protein MUF69_08010, partial [Desulfobacterota bacterium]|nr:hypothetical protein [Thermodesulfobacteriota bacterium]
MVRQAPCRRRRGLRFKPHRPDPGLYTGIGLPGRPGPSAPGHRPGRQADSPGRPGRLPPPGAGNPAKRKNREPSCRRGGHCHLVITGGSLRWLALPNVPGIGRSNQGNLISSNSNWGASCSRRN